MLNGNVLRERQRQVIVFLFYFFEVKQMAFAQFQLLNTLPGSLDPHTFYYVLNGANAESYLTDANSVAKAIGNTARTNALITAALASLNTIQKVANIAARNALESSLNTNAMVLVADATGDNTVAAGAATYFWDDALSSWSKISEYESLDVITTWASLSGKPTSAVADIDDAVTKRHAHANKTIIDKWGESGGEPTYNGQFLDTRLKTADW
jgi:hypothetical protein